MKNGVPKHQGVKVTLLNHKSFENQGSNPSQKLKLWQSTGIDEIV